MSSFNRATVLGNLGADPEVRYTGDGRAVANLSIATSERWKDKATGEMREQTEWHRVVLFGRPAEIAKEYLSKGSQCLVEGSIRTRKWQDKQGNDRYTTEIDGQRLVLLGGRDGGAGAAGAGGTTGRGEYGAASAGTKQPPAGGDGDDVPY